MENEAAEQKVTIEFPANWWKPPRGDDPSSQPTKEQSPELKKFLAIERIARMPEKQQADHLTELYRELSPAFMNPFMEWALSSTPRNILQRNSGPYDGDTQRWGEQLADAASTMTSEQVADRLENWVSIAARSRAIYVFQRHPEATAALITSDLDSLDKQRVGRAGHVIVTLNLRKFTPRLVKLFIEREELSEPTSHTLLFLKDPECVAPLLEKVKEDPRFLIRCSAVLQSGLVKKPADPTLLELLNSPDADIKFAAVTALIECRDKQLAGPAVQMARDREARFRVAAAELAIKLPDETFQTVRADLLPLLKDADGKVKMAALRCFSQREDLAAGPVILEMLKAEQVDEQDKVPVMQALSKLAGTNFNYDLHHWGPSNVKPIKEFEEWLAKASNSP